MAVKLPGLGVKSNQDLASSQARQVSSGVPGAGPAPADNEAPPAGLQQPSPFGGGGASGGMTLPTMSPVAPPPPPVPESYEGPGLFGAPPSPGAAAGGLAPSTFSAPGTPPNPAFAAAGGGGLGGQPPEELLRRLMALSGQGA
jgi:hypothetical protein